MDHKVSPPSTDQPWTVNRMGSSNRGPPGDTHLRGKNGIHEKIIADPLSSAYKNAKKDLDFSPEHRW